MTEIDSPVATRVPFLTIGIPTYNFGSTLGETLDSIIDQYVEGVEVLVLDSNSTDDTRAVVAVRQARCAGLRYVRAARDGIDRDMAKVVDQAGADTIWLFSADDVMRPGALCRVIDAIVDADVDMVLLSHSNCTFDMQVLIAKHPVLRGPSRRFVIDDPRRRAAYFCAAETTEAFFSYISGLVIRRSAWHAGSNGELFVGSCWSHAARLLRTMATQGLRIAYVADILVDRRGDNDSFGAHGVVRRYALAVDGYTSIATTLFGPDSVELVHIRRVLRREFGLVMFMLARRRCLEDPSREDRARLDALFAILYADDTRGWYRRPIYRWVSPNLFLAAFGAARSVYRRFR